jgi:RNA recognition motif-containing protein
MKNIFIGNLNPTATPETIRALFTPFGTVHKCKLMVDKTTGLSRGFAFVEMVDAEAGLAIAALAGSMVDGQMLEVREGRPILHRTLPPTRDRQPGSAPDVP